MAGFSSIIEGCRNIYCDSPLLFHGKLKNCSAHRRNRKYRFNQQTLFNDAVQEFIKKRTELANYFETDHKGDIFDYIPP